VSAIHDPAKANWLMTGAYRARTAIYDAIEFGRLPGDVVAVGHDFWMRNGDCVISETIPNNIKDVGDAFARGAKTAEMDSECVLLCRWGHSTWGHWLGEILPLAALIERVFPGRFRYAVFREIEKYAIRIRESLAAYDIGEDRILDISPGYSWSFSRAYMATPAWSDFSPHPIALDVMRGSIRLPPADGGARRVALLRSGKEIRTIQNSDEVEKLLIQTGFPMIDLPTLSFVEQVNVFRSASSIFSTLGSGLAGIIFANEGVKITAVRPQNWTDRFFYALAQHRRARWTEIAGPSYGDDAFRSPFFVPMESLIHHQYAGI
jgi:hypothetical protein